jgi:hypothetical protein
VRRVSVVHDKPSEKVEPGLERAEQDVFSVV